jgi:Polysaccharide deacetylase/Chitobiase/beta-hexosaminidase C-terminal domain/Bacterial Ig domain
VRRLALFLSAACAALFLGPGSAVAAQTVVSLTFDDGWDNQQTAYSMLAAHGLTGTFYVNSGDIGQPGHLSWDQLTTFNAAGNEIGGHTLTHPDLTTLTSTQAQHEICDDRTAILGHGFVAPSFAYPFGAYDANTGGGTLDVSSLVTSCGYASGRGAFGLHNITATNDTRPYATSIPPPNVRKILTPCCINHASFGGSTPTAAALQGYVQNAQAQLSPNPGWVIFVFHRICDNCGGDSPAAAISPSEFNAFLDWLQSSGAVVKTVGQVIKNDTQAATSSIACGGAACSSGWYGDPVSVSLSAADGGSGVAAIRYTTDGSEPTAASPLYTGPFTVSSTTTVKYRAWDKADNVEATKSRTIQVDTAAPTSSIACDGSACSSSAYAADVSVTLSASDGESGVSVIRYTLDGSDPTASSTAYSGPITVSETTTVKYRAWDDAGNVEAANSQLITVTKPAADSDPPTSSIACNLAVCSTGWYGGPVSVSLSAADGGSGVAAIRYTTDGSEPTAASPLYTAPFTVSSTTTVKYRAWDKADNVEATNSQLIRIDTAAPTSSISCSGTTCATGWYKASVPVALSATDGGSGVAVIRYTTDGSDPTAASTAYSGPFTVSATTTVRFRAWDNAGNVEATKSQLIRIDTLPPTVAITSPTNNSTVRGTVKVTATASDNTGGSGVSIVSFYMENGANDVLIGTKSGAPFTISWNTKKLAGQRTLYAVARDAAGNEATSAPITVTVT